jgi:peptidoglycan/xylan/chitin deacetylase (PgdA/CDA1 family)
MRIAITVDVERDLGFLDSHLGIDEGLPVILRLLARHGISGTFFVSGIAVAHLRDTGLLQDIEARGHEIASHGFHHTDYRTWDDARVREEVARSKDALTRYVARPVTGFRTPQFLVNGAIMRALADCGFRYDSSFPDRSGVSAARQLRGTAVDEGLMESLRASGLREFPVDSLPLLRIPHALLWANLVGFSVYRRLFQHIAKDFMLFYMHPFDVIPRKDRARLDFKRRVFYLKNRDGIGELLSNLIDYWADKGVTFVTLEQECAHADNRGGKGVKGAHETFTDSRSGRKNVDGW